MRHSPAPLSPHLVPLQQPQPIESTEVSELRRAKKRMREFDEGQKALKRLYGQGRRKQQLLHKGAHRHCAYHTYDYEANLIKVTQLRLQHMMDKDGHFDPSPPTLNHLLAQHMLMQKVPAVRKAGSLPKPSTHEVGKKHNITVEEQESEQQGKKAGSVSPHKPLFRFEKSSVRSLAEGAEGMMSTGVKMVTTEQQLVSRNSQGYHVEEEQVVRQKKKTKSQKQKTGSSQSVIYMLGGDLLNSRQNSREAPSLDNEREGQLNRSIQLELEVNPESRKEVKLPPITPSRHSQPALKGLEHVTIESPSMSRVSGHSSSQEGKESVKEYFGGYGRQFRQKRLWDRAVK